MNPLDLNRYNRTYEVFKNMRGTAMYYQKAKKNVLSMLRQFGCPTAFITLSCAEYDWPSLLKEIVETVERRKVTEEYIESLSVSRKNQLITDNVVQSTIHFQKRMDKIFTLMKGNFFHWATKTYHICDYFYRIEFQMRGSPHVHAVIWMKDSDNNDAPNFWFTENKTYESCH